MRATGTLESLPDSIESLIAGEIDRLAPTDRTILRYAAVLGATFDPDLLRRWPSARTSTSTTTVWARLGGLVQRGADGHLRFRNTLIRDAAYEGLPYRRRRVLHARVGETIEARAGGQRSTRSRVLALHFHEAQRWDKAWRMRRQAGERAMSIYAIADASRFYELALVGRTSLAEPCRAPSSPTCTRAGATRCTCSADTTTPISPPAARRLVEARPDRRSRRSRSSRRSSRPGREVPRGEQPGHARAPPSLAARGREAAAARARLMVVQTRHALFPEPARGEHPMGEIGRARGATARTPRTRLPDAYKLLDLALKESGELDQAIYSERALRLYEELGDLRSQAIVLNNLGVIAQERLDGTRRCSSTGSASRSDSDR